MTQPTAYVPAHTFVTDESLLPEFPGAQLDIEINALKTFTEQVRTNLALIQRDDGALLNGVVTADALDPVLAASLGDLSSLAEVQALIDSATASAATATTQASAASTSATTASTQASNASTSATTASTQATNAAASALAAAAASAAVAFKFTWSTNTASSDPTAGGIKVNAAPGSATALYISETDASGNALASEIARWDDATSTNGKCRLKIAKDATNFLLLTITSAVTDNGTWDTFTVGSAVLVGTLGNGDTVYVQPVLNGNDGAGSLSGMTNHGIPIASAAATVATSVVLTDGQLLVGQTGADPLAKTITGDVTITAAGATAIKTSVSLTTPTLGVAAATSINKVAITAPATSATLTIADGKTATINNSLTLAGSDSTTMTFPAVSSTVLTKDNTALLVAGFNATSFSAGTKSSGTFTPDPASGNMQHYTNGGAHTLAPPATCCTMVIECVNSSAGALTTSGFTVVSGDTFSSTGTKKHIFYITKTNSVSQLNVQYVTGT